MKAGVSEHQDALTRTSKTVKGTLETWVMDHILICDYQVAWDDFRTLGTKSNKFILELKESMFNKRDNLTLKKNQFSQELLLI